MASVLDVTDSVSRRAQRAEEQSGPPDMPIDELARRARSTTRNVRALQSAGVLLPPRIQAWTAHYTAAHLARLEAVLRLQRSGFSLASIRTLLDALSAGRTLSEVLGLHPDTVGTPGSRTREAPGGGALRLLSILPSTVLDQAL